MPPLKKIEKWVRYLCVLAWRPKVKFESVAYHFVAESELFLMVIYYWHCSEIFCLLVGARDPVQISYYARIR